MRMASRVNEFALIVPSVADGTRPAGGTTIGAAVTPGNNAYGSYAQVIAGAAVTDDVYGVWININGFAASTILTDCLVTLGIDPAGGTTFTDWINHLLCSCGGDRYVHGATQGGGISYYFPIFLKAGTSIGAKASMNNGAPPNVGVQVVLFCRPTRPELLRVGKFVRTFGEVTASSRGTLITPGTAAEGAWTQLGIAIAEPLWCWDFGCGLNDTAILGNSYVCDIGIGDGSNKKVAIRDGLWSTSTTEAAVKHLPLNPYRQAAVGDIVYARSQVGPSGADVDFSMIAYGVGG